MINIFTGKYTT